MNVIYVYPNGKAHTIEQAHEKALIINKELETFAGAVEKFTESLRVVGEEVERILKGIWETIKSVVGDAEYTVGKWKKKKGGLRKWLRANTRTRECSLKSRLKSQTNFMDKRAWHSFRKSRHRGK